MSNFVTFGFTAGQSRAQSIAAIVAIKDNEALVASSGKDFVRGYVAGRLYPTLTRKEALAKAELVINAPEHVAGETTHKDGRVRRTDAEQRAVGAGRVLWADLKSSAGVVVTRGANAGKVGVSKQERDAKRLRKAAKASIGAASEPKLIKAGAPEANALVASAKAAAKATTAPEFLTMLREIAQAADKNLHIVEGKNAGFISGARAEALKKVHAALAELAALTVND